MKTTRLVLIWFAMLLVAASCAVKVRTLRLPNHDFSKYQTFCWLESCEFTFRGPDYLNDSLVRSYMQKAIKSEMKRKGIAFNSDNPDLLMDVQVVMKTDTGYAYHRPDEVHQFIPFTNREEVLLLKGTFIIDLIDKQQGKMVWRSVAISYFDLYPALTQANVDRAVAAALQQFPRKKQQ
ncbi:MAG: DUF4136 domain-containing protein [Cyclobacteriaceae bacterium]|nr:DUF4136 domain-containing protein [Cyclobacteriaceae bacterium]